MPSAGDPFNASDFTTLINYSGTKPVTSLAQSVAQTGIANNTTFAASFTTENIDTDGYHDNVTNNTRITPNRSGVFRFDGAITFSSRTDYTLLYSFIRVNGATQVPYAGRVSLATGQSGAFTWMVPCSATVVLNGTTDYVEICGLAINTAAATFSTVVSGPQACALNCEFLRV